MNEFIAKLGLKLINKRKLTHSIVDIVFDEMERAKTTEENVELTNLRKENESLKEILSNIKNHINFVPSDSTESQTTTSKDPMREINLDELLHGLFGNTNKKD